MHNHCVRKIKMSPEEWAELERLAHETCSVLRTGRGSMRVSWVALLRALANGKVKLVETGPHVEHKRRVDAALAQLAKDEAKAAQSKSEYTQIALLEADSSARPTIAA